MISKDYAGLDNFFLDESTKGQPDARRQLVETFGSAVVVYTHPKIIDRKTEATPAQVAEEQKALYAYLKASKPAWEQAKNLGGYYDRTVGCLVYFHKDKAERDRMLDEAVAYIKTIQDKAIADEHFDRLIELCRAGQAPDRARYLIAQLTDRPAAYREYEVLAAESKWDAAAKQLQEVEGSGQPAWADRRFSSAPASTARC